MHVSPYLVMMHPNLIRMVENQIYDSRTLLQGLTLQMQQNKAYRENLKSEKVLQCTFCQETNNKETKTFYAFQQCVQHGIFSHFMVNALNDHLEVLIANRISAHADGGPCSQFCARKTLCLAPHQRERKFYGAESAESPSNISPNTSEVISEVLEPQDNF